MRRLCSLMVCLVALGAGAPCVAQRAPAPVRIAQPRTMAQEVEVSATFLASAVLPGTAQLLAGDDRWFAYMAAEGWAWVSYIQKRREFDRLETRYRDLAWQVARRVSAGARRDSVFEYYEAMAHYSTSGAFDAEPVMPGIQPERQTGTFNGDLWALAQDLFLAGAQDAVPGAPGYDSALGYYTARAIPPQFAWAWGASNLEQQVFADLITQSDAAYRAGTRYLGLILANHVVSAVDALVTARLRQLGAGSLRLETIPLREGATTRWQQTIRISF